MTRKKPDKGPQPPAHLADATKKWFRQVVADYEFESHHIKLLILACESWDRCVQARQVLATEGLTYVDRFDQPRSRPEVAIEKDSRISFARLIRELALDIEPPADTRPPRIGGAKG